MGDYMPSYNDPVAEYMIEHYPELYNNANNDIHNIGDIPKRTKHLSKLSCGHEPIEAMEIVCDLYYNKIIELYGEIKPYKNGEKLFYRLKEYYSARTQRLLHYNEWIFNT
jgi:hypothetical protein